MSADLTVTDENFNKQVLESDIPVLVDFWAAWCGPCRTIAPVIEELAADFEGRVKVRKLNVDDSPETARKYGIRSIPMLVLFDDGEVKEAVVGVQPRSSLEKLLNQHSG